MCFYLTVQLEFDYGEVGVWISVICSPRFFNCCFYIFYEIRCLFFWNLRNYELFQLNMNVKMMTYPQEFGSFRWLFWINTLLILIKCLKAPPKNNLRKWKPRSLRIRNSEKGKRTEREMKSNFNTKVFISLRGSLSPKFLIPSLLLMPSRFP